MTLVALRTHRVLVAGLLLVVSLSLAGCGRQPQVKPMNRRLIESLRTALSARNTEWLDANWKLIEKAHTDGSMDDAEFSRFKEIVDIARSGEWADAEEQVVKLAKGQKPVAGASHDHAHKHDDDHKHKHP